MMLFHDTFYVGEPQTETFHVVNIPGRYAVKTFKYLVEILF